METVIKEAGTLVNGLKHMSVEHRELTLTKSYVDLGFNKEDKDFIILDDIIDKEDDRLLIYAFQTAFSNIKINDEMKIKLLELNFNDMMKVYFTFIQENYHVISEEESYNNTVNCLLELLC